MDAINPDIIIGAGGFTSRELGEDLARCGESVKGVEILCRRCNRTWTPGLWNFYNLYNECFTEFDDQKMRGRFSFLTEEGNKEYYSESCDQWMKDFPYIPNS